MSFHRNSVRPYGFTLVELMVVLVIIAVLLKIAVPQYTSYIQKSNRTSAKTALLDLAAREEKFYSLNNAYSATAASLGYAGTFPVSVPLTGTATYTLTAPVIGTSNPPSFSASAVPVAGGAQSTDACGTFTINSLGQQAVTGGTQSSNCW